MIDIRKITNGYWWDAQGKYDTLIGNKLSLKEITIQVTDRCNLACPKCNKVNFTFKDMDTYDILKIIDEAYDLGLKHVHFTGGEPTMHPDFIGIVKYCRAYGLRIDMSTNGKFNDEYINELALAGIDSVNVSWDFIDKVPDCFKNWKPSEIRWFINHMVMPSNYKELPDFLKHIKEFYSYIIDIQLMPPRGTADKFTKEQIEDYYTDAIVKESFNIAKDRFTMVEKKLSDILIDKEAPKGIYHTKISWPCHRSKVELRVGPKGFATCTYLYRDGHVTCGLDNSVKEAWERCKNECQGKPPVPHMCDYSCSPEVAYFNYFVENRIN
jgi:MoaA/NifB/PqqE/SkfB family radical SAM enzyme